jgi:hypothetical protein
MNSLRRIVLVGLCLSVANSLHAQSADVQTPATTVQPAKRTLAPVAPPFTVHNSGATKAVLVPFGPYITQVGAGFGGANVSEVYTTFTLGSVGYNIFGFGMQSSVNITVADDFKVPGATTWFPSGVRWVTYQTGASTSGTITSMNLNLWNTPPAGQLPGNQWVTGSNQLQTSTWTGVYRVLDSTLTANTRALIQVNCGGAWMPSLSPGSYWIEANAGGSLSSGPWAPPKTNAGQVPPTNKPWNGVQSVSLGAFAQVVDTGNPVGTIFEPADFLWQLEGSSSGGISTFCTSKTSSLGCTPTLVTTSATAAKSSLPATLITAAPVPGGSGLPGILIYSKTPPVAPVVTSFGFLCLSGFARAGAFPSAPGGRSGSCSGMYIWNVADIAAGTPTIVIGDVLRIQGWYRDPGFPPPGNANFTNGINAVTIVGGSAPGPSGLSITPTTGGEGTPVTVTGGNFGTDPGDLALLLANGLGFGDVTSAAGNSLIATVFPVGTTGTGAVTVIHGVGLTLPNQNITLGISSSSTAPHAVTNGAGTNFGTFNLTPTSANTVSASSGTPASGISASLSGFTFTTLRYRLSIKSSLSAEFSVFQGEINFAGVPTDLQSADHLAAHLNASYGTLGVSASASGSSVRVSMAGAAYGGIVVKGV